MQCAKQARTLGPGKRPAGPAALTSVVLAMGAATIWPSTIIWPPDDPIEPGIHMKHWPPGSLIGAAAPPTPEEEGGGSGMAWTERLVFGLRFEREGGGGRSLLGYGSRGQGRAVS